MSDSIIPTLREAADHMHEQYCHHTARLLRDEADRLDREAARDAEAKEAFMAALAHLQPVALKARQSVEFAGENLECAAVANFTVASTPRTFDRQKNEWVDGEPLFLRCNIWKEAAENVAESLSRGSRVIVQGRLKQRSYETREGEKRTVVELEVDEIGPSLRYVTAKPNKANRSGAPKGKPQQADDPWGSGATDSAPF